MHGGATLFFCGHFLAVLVLAKVLLGVFLLLVYLLKLKSYGLWWSPFNLCHFLRGVL